MRRYPFWKGLALLTLIALAGCAVPPAPVTTPEPAMPEPQNTQPAEPEMSSAAVKSDKARVTDPQVSEEAVAALAAGNNRFALDLYRQLSDEQGNLFFSPYSISLALAMTQAGAEGQTLEEMNQVLHFDLPKEDLHPAFNALDQALAEHAAEVPDPEQTPFTLRIANSIWGQKDYAFLPEFLDLLAENYGAGLRVVDFQSNPEAARLVINDWIAEQSEQKIEDLIPQGAINEVTRMVLANAVYFNAAWLFPFYEGNTEPGTFNPLVGEPVEVPMMRQSANFGYASGGGWEVVELPYVSRSLVMDLIVPAAGEFSRVESELDYDRLMAMLDEVSYGDVRLTMPKFEFESEIALAENLKALGMQTAFSDAADFSGMTGTDELFIQDALHKAFVAVDEAGTEAAAATAVIVGAKGAPINPPEVVVDRPFIFAIRDRSSGTVLFLGRVVELQP